MPRKYLPLFFLGWLIAFSAFAQSRFSQDVRGYDLESLVWAAAMSLFGGALRTIFTLASDTAVVHSVGREIFKDALIAVIAGIVAYIALEAIRASGWMPVPSEVRFALIVFAGWSRMKFFGVLDTFGHRVSEAVMDKITGKIAAPTESPKE